MRYITLQKIQTKKIVTFCLRIFVLIFFLGCINNSKINVIPSNHKQISSIIVLFHGLNCPNDPDIAELGQKLARDISNSKIIILNRYNSTQVSTTQQAIEAYMAFKKELNKEQLPNNIPTIIIGDSQGGLLSIELYRLYKRDLNIVGILTNHTPLEGAPGANAFQDTKKLQSMYKNKVSRYIISLIDIYLVKLKDKLADMGTSMKSDLKSKSTLLQHVSTTLSTIDIPVLALGGTIDFLPEGLCALINFTSGKNINPTTVKMGLKHVPKHVVQGMTNVVDNIIGDSKNDTFVPLYSQIGEHIPNNSNFNKKVWPNYHHFYGMTTNYEIYNTVQSFVKDCLQSKI